MANPRQKSAVSNTSEASKERVKTVCPITREEFLEEAKGLVLKVGDNSVVAGVREFTTGSFGWYTNEKTAVTIGGVVCKVQMNVQLVLIGSKPEDR